MRKTYLLCVVYMCLGICGCSDGASEVKTEGDQESPSKCGNECTDDVCDGISGVNKCLDTNHDGCLEVVREDCPSGTSCSDGRCVSKPTDCSNSCKGDNVCEGEKLKTCKDADGDGCREWVVEDCPPNMVCSDGTCQDAKEPCRNTCDGPDECDGKSSYKTCTDNNGDGCREWVTQKCAEGTECSNGICQAPTQTCKNACSGPDVCDGTSGFKTCKDSDNDGCKEWVAQSCDPGKVCSGGKCSTPACKYTKATDPGLDPLPGESAPGKSESVKNGSFTDEYLYDATSYIKIGARREWGGSIIFFGLTDGNKGTNNTNTIDSNDTGREVQVAIYDRSRLRQNCAYNASCGYPTCEENITHLGWNPVQGGNRCNVGSGYKSVNNKNGIMEIVTIPLHWNPNWDFKDCTSSGCDTDLRNLRSDVQLTQRLRFVSTNVVELFYSIKNLAAIDHTPYEQELPTLYTTYGANDLGDYRRLMTPDKTEITIPGVIKFTTSAPWVTLQNADLNYGVGLLYENGLLHYSGWQKLGVFNNVRSDITFGLPANGTVNARAYLMLGGFDTIKSLANNLMQTLPPFGVVDVPAEGAAVSGSNVTVSGWALDNKSVSKVIAKIDEDKTFNLKYGTSRPDVCKIWVGYPTCDKVGYTGTIDVSSLDTNCKHLLEIIATDGDGNERTIARRLLTVK
ncbi:MAG: hypothetical protein IJM59_00390 [Proteobacteria bacterium]|nr:hypothetical protein [Pseudomonadota bacterium]